MKDILIKKAYIILRKFKAILPYILSKRSIKYLARHGGHIGSILRGLHKVRRANEITTGERNDYRHQ